MKTFPTIFVLLFFLAACTESVVSTTSPPTSTTATSTTSASAPSPSTSLADTPYTTVARIPFTDLLVLDVLQPHGDGPWPITVLVHGGGWVGGERADVSDLAALLATRGMLVYNISYRTMALGGSYPTAYEDVACGVRFARTTAYEYGGNPSSVTLAGYSAGAHLAAVVALAGNEFDGDCLAGGSGLPDAFVGIAGPYDSDQFSPLLIPFFGGPRAEAADAWSAGNPYSYVDRRISLPIHLLQGTADRTVPQRFTIDFAAALEAAGHTVELTIIEGAGHRDMVDPSASGPIAVEAMLGLLP